MRTSGEAAAEVAVARSTSAPTAARPPAPRYPELVLILLHMAAAIIRPTRPLHDLAHIHNFSRHDMRHRRRVSMDSRRAGPPNRRSRRPTTADGAPGTLAPDREPRPRLHR